MKKKLLQAWLQFTEGDVLELLHRLDVENCPEVAISVLNAMFSLSLLNDIVQNCKNLDSRYAEHSSFPKDVLYVKDVLYENVKQNSFYPLKMWAHFQRL